MTPVQFVEDNLYFLPGLSNRLVSGKKIKNFIIPFQKEVLKSVLEDNKDIFIGYTRQISKSTLFSWIVLYLLQQRPGSRGFCMASKYEQSAHVFNAVRDQILFRKKLKEQYELTKHWAKHINGSFFKRASSKPGGELGNMAFSFGVIDELAVYNHQTKEAMQNLLNGMAMSGHKPLLMFGCNPPSDPEHWSIDFIKKLQADTGTRCFIFSAPLKDDIFKPTTWAKANPFIKFYLTTKDKNKKQVYQETYNFYKRQASLTKESKEAELEFKRQLLGQKIQSDAYKFCDIQKIKIADDSIYIDKSVRWCLGIDPAWTKNFCAFSIVGFSEETESLFVKCFLFLSNTNIRNPSQKLQFNEWHKQDFIKIWNQDSIPKNNTIDIVKRFIKKHNLQLEKVMADPGQSKQWEFEKPWPNLEYVYNSPRHMTGAIRYLEKVCADGKLFFIGKSPALSTQFDSAIVSIKSKDYCSISKQSDWASVDGVVATTLAVKHLSETKQKKIHAFYI